MDIVRVLAQELNVRSGQVEAAVNLIDEGNTIPFIARYRKEMTGSLDDVQLRQLSERLVYLRNLEEKKQQVMATIEAQGFLTEELRRKLEQAQTQVEVEDLYRPFRPKRRTRAIIAREKGLEPLAERIRLQQLTQPAMQEAEAFVDPEKEVSSAQEALAGAKDILAEEISDTAEYRIRIREMTMQEGVLSSAAKDEKLSSVYEMYYQYEEAVKKTAGHRILALNRGEKEKILTVKLKAPQEEILSYLQRQIIQKKDIYSTPILKEAIADSYERLIAPSIEREVRNALTEQAEDGAIAVFGKNLKQLLMQPPVAGKVVLGWDPGYRNGCKLAVVDETGKVLDSAVIYPTPPTNERKIREAKDTVIRMIRTYDVTLISLGNGTASRESEQIIVELLKEIPQYKVSYVFTSEAGASVYSASKLAAEEFPTFTVEQRSAASIARRVQDPLAELVKIDPKAIGVGQYQHDMNQKKLGETLDGVVEDCVNGVGVDLNTASAPLMEHISGITKTIARNIVEYRESHGSFTNRKELLKVAKLGPKAYEQCAGFMRIRKGSEPLDSTSIHPESYAAAEELFRILGLSKDALATQEGLVLPPVNFPKVAKQISIGEPTLRDIVKELKKPGRDPRSSMPGPVLRTDVLDIKDLKEGMILKGTVRNVIDFGAFVDIGVHQDGLVHISQLSKERFVKHPLDVVSVGDIVEVKVLSVDAAKHRIALTMKF